MQIELLTTEPLRSVKASREDCRAGGDQRAWHGNWIDWGDAERVATCQHWKGRVLILLTRRSDGVPCSAMAWSSLGWGRFDQFEFHQRSNARAAEKTRGFHAVVWHFDVIGCWEFKTVSLKLCGLGLQAFFSSNDMWVLRVGDVFKNHAEAALLRAVSGDQRVEQWCAKCTHALPVNLYIRRLVKCLHSCGGQKAVEPLWCMADSRKA